MTIQSDVPNPSSQLSAADDIKPEKRSSAAMVLEAAWDLHTRELIVTRETVADFTGLKLTTVDDRLGVLVDEGRLKRVLRGVYEPVTVHPPARPQSISRLPDGIVVHEIGDSVQIFTPREARDAALLFAGFLSEAHVIGDRHQSAAIMAEMALELKVLKRKVAIMEARDANSRDQLRLDVG